MLVQTNGVKLNVEIEGREGAPWLTFSNSLATDLTMWDAQVAALKDRYRILRYDKRGHGKSDAPKGPYDLPMLVKDVIGLWDHFGIRRSHFVGLSIGGMTALGLGIDHAARLLSIVPCDCRADSPAEFRDSWDPRIAVAEGPQGCAGLVPATLERWFTAETRKAHPDRMAYMTKLISTTSVAGEPRRAPPTAPPAAPMPAPESARSVLDSPQPASATSARAASVALIPMFCITSSVVALGAARLRHCAVG
jgi:3-oxoadipate enol-lactonase